MKPDTSWVLWIVVNLFIAVNLSFGPGAGREYRQVLG